MNYEKKYSFSLINEKGGEKAVDIIYKNEAINLPFQLEKLAFFVDESGSKQLDTHYNHHRAAWLPKMGIADKQNNIYFQTTLKGLGFLYPETYQSKKDNFYGNGSETMAVHTSVEDPWGYKVLGLFDRRNAEVLKNNAQELTELGMRCEAIAGIMSIKKIIWHNEVINLNQLRIHLKRMAEDAGLKKAIVNDLSSFEPVEVVRLVRENMRIKDFCEANYENKKAMLSETFRTLNLENKLQNKEGEYSLENIESVKQYLRDFFEQAGKNLAIMHSNGKMMSYLNSGNITLSLAEVVDLDSIISLNKGMSAHITPHSEWMLPKGYVKDSRDMLYALGKMFLTNVEELIRIDKKLRSELCKILIEGYTQLLDSDELKMHKIDRQKLSQLLNEFAKTSIEDNRSLSPVKLT